MQKLLRGFKNVLVIIFLWCFVALAMHPMQLPALKHYSNQIDVTLSSENVSSVQIFYHAGNGFRFKDSQVITIKADGSLQQVQLDLPARRVHGLQFRPTGALGQVTVHNINWKSKYGDNSPSQGQVIGINPNVGIPEEYNTYSLLDYNKRLALLATFILVLILLVRHKVGFLREVLASRFNKNWFQIFHRAKGKLLLWLSASAIMWCGFSHFAPSFMLPSPLEVVATVKSDTSGFVALYYDYGTGFDENTKQFYYLHKDTLEEATFPAPAGSLQQILLKPSDSHSSIQLQSVEISSKGHKVVLDRRQLGQIMQAGEQPVLSSSDIGSGLLLSSKDFPILFQARDSYLWYQGGMILISIVLGGVLLIGGQRALLLKTEQKYFLAVVLLSGVSLLLSIYRGATVIDDYHWGMMQNSANELLAGKIPYRETFLQYGLLNSALHAAFFKLFGASYWSLGLSTGFFYAANQMLLFKVWRRVAPARTALIANLCLFALHPYIVYPWATYFVFTFMLLGILGLLKWRYESTGSLQRLLGLLFVGVCFGLAVLVRDGTLLIIVCGLVILVIFELLSAPNRVQAFFQISKSYGFVLIGLTLPLGIFALYLMHYGIVADWRLQSVDVKNFYISFAFGDDYFLSRLFIYVTSGVFKLAKPTAFVFSWILWISTLSLSVYFYRLVKSRVGMEKAFPAVVTAIFAVLFYSNSLLYPDIFRFANGAILGLGGCLLFLGKVQWRLPVAVLQLKLSMKQILLAIVILGGIQHFVNIAVSSRQYGELFPIPATTPQNIPSAGIPTAFLPQKWKPGKYIFYARFLQIFKDINEVQDPKCRITHLENFTQNSLFTVFSPFPVLHRTPWVGTAGTYLLNDVLDPNYQSRAYEARKRSSTVMLVWYKTLTEPFISTQIVETPEQYVPKLEAIDLMPKNYFVYQAISSYKFLLPKSCKGLI